MARSRTHKKEKVIKTYKRKIHFDNDEVWTYEIKTTINIKDPDGNKHVVNWEKFTGWSSSELQNGCDHDYGPEITPSRIKKWIEAYKECKEYSYE